MKITRITITNFLKLVDVDLAPGKMNVIIGKNKQGKTSILKAIKAAFTGDTDASMIHVGDSKAEILLELDEINIKRTITEKSSQLKVTNKDGFRVDAPKKFLDGLVGTFSFNPVEFFELKAGDRKKYLLQAMDMRMSQQDLANITGEKLEGINYEAHALEVLAAAHQYYYAQRTLINASIKENQNTITTLLATVPEGFKPTDFEEAKIKNLQAQVTTNEVAKQKLEEMKRESSRLSAEAQELKAKLNIVLDRLTVVTDGISVAEKTIQDTTIIQGEIDLLGKGQKHVNTLKQIEATRQAIKPQLEKQEKLETVVKYLANEAPAELLKKVALPVAGLTLDGDSVLINGVSLDNLSTSEQIKFGLDIVKKLNDKFKIICIDGIEALDKESFDFFIKETENDDYQYFVTRVAQGNDKGIIIEDGKVTMTTPA